MSARQLFAAALAALALGCSASAAENDIQDLVFLGEKGPVLIRLHVRIDGKPLVDVWEGFIGEVFAHLDRDGDGVLNRAEAAQTPPAQVLFNNVANFVGQRVSVPSTMDANRDGRVTRAELAGWYRLIGAGPFHIQSSNTPTSQLLLAAYVEQMQPLSANALNEKLFSLLDANEDGKLSQEEVARAPIVLHKLDLDEDDMISVQELSESVRSDAETSSDFLVRNSFPENPVGGPFVLVNPGEASKELAQRFLNHYRGKGLKAVAEELTRHDLGLDEASFKHLDMDEDGQLDYEELARFAQRHPDLELCVRLGKNDNKAAALETVSSKDHLSPLAKPICLRVEGGLRVELGATWLELCCADAAKEPRPEFRLSRQYLDQFRMADKDINGYLDHNEAMRAPAYRNAFGVMDRDGDGKLFKKEVIAYLDKMQEFQTAARRCCVSLSVRDMGRGLFNFVDANIDGRLGAREMRQMVKLVDRLDRDGDHQISRGEVPHRYRLDMRLGPARETQLAPQVPVARQVLANNQPRLPERGGPLWFQKMDRNHDGELSRREFLGSDEAYRQIDRDGDGVISAEEAKQADQMFRKENERKP